MFALISQQDFKTHFKALHRMFLAFGALHRMSLAFVHLQLGPASTGKKLENSHLVLLISGAVLRIYEMLTAGKTIFTQPMNF